MPYLKRASELPHENAERRDAVRLRYAESLLGEARIDEAERIVREVMKERPDDPRSRFNLGLIAVAREQWEQAKSLLEPLEKNLFARKKVYAQLATIHFRLGHNVEAENYQMQAERAPTDLYWIDPFITEINRMEVGRQSQWGQIQRLESEGRLREANRLLVEQAQLFGDTKTFLVLGINFTKLKEWSNAEIALREALRLDPEAVQGYVFLGIALCEQSKWEESLAASREALKRKPDQAFAHLYAGRALLELKRLDEAIAALREAVRCRPEQADTHMRLGEALMEAKQRDEGLRELKFAVELAPPEDPRPRQMLEKYR